MSRSADAARRALARVASPTEVGDATLARPTVVVAPHPDDETLGCGGTIARLRSLDVPVGIVFATDGAGSHRQIAPDRLASIRQQEAVEAAAVLGVEADALRFCGVRDGTLQPDDDRVGAAVASIIRSIGATRLVVPSTLEPPSDHVNAGRAARRALPSTSGIDVWEYGVWAWDGWPWVPGSGRSFWRRTVTGGLGLITARAFSLAVDVSDVVDVKERALACHHTQMGTFEGGADWPTLRGVRGGAWLEVLMGDHERFRPRP